MISGDFIFFLYFCYSILLNVNTKETEKIWMRIMCLTCVRHSKKFGKWMITGKNIGAHVIFVVRHLQLVINDYCQNCR